MTLPRLRPLLCGALLLVLPTLLRAENPFTFDTTPGQLPKTIVPRHYALRIQPDLENRVTTGVATIEIEVRQPVQALVLHALELTIDSAELIDDPTAPQSLTATIDAAQQTLTLPVSLAAGHHTLRLNYRGKIGTSSHGFFVDKYRTPSGATKLMLCSQMESTDARSVFPCWDEPSFRATYDITLVLPTALMGVSNMPITSEEPAAPGFKAVSFARTPSMPSYLVAMYAGEFEVLEGEYDGIKLRILATEGKLASTHYALESTKRILAYYHDYFGVKYPLPKLDQIAVPNAFSGFSAMENWGCITYIDTALLYDPARDSQSGKERVFGIIAHEVAHQWFGNIVTMAWWDNLWLNEGFASWLPNKVTQLLNPDWQAWRRANQMRDYVMQLDARANTHAIVRPIATAGEAANAFDAISYGKGEAFLRMLETWLGEDSFRAGIQNYIKTHAYSNTTSADLWQALDAATGHNVSSFATNWTERPGFPIVSLTARETAGRRELVLRQTRFTLGPAEPDSAPWPIPVTYATLEHAATPETVLFDQAELILPRPAGNGPVLLNLGNNGYYRVQYDDALAADLQAHIQQVDVDSQINLLADTWALAQADRLPVTRWLDLATALGGSEDPIILSGILGKLGAIDGYETGQPGQRAFQVWARGFLQPIMDRLTYEAQPGESPLLTTLRSTVIGQLAHFGDSAVIAWAKDRFEDYRRDPNSLPGNLASTVFQIVGRHADRATYDELHAIARQATTTQVQRRAYGAMQAAQDPALQQITMALSLGDEMPAGESNRNLSRIADAADDPMPVIEYAIAHYDALVKRVGNFEAYGYLPAIMSAAPNAQQADRLLAFTKDKLPPDALPVAARTAESMRERAKFIQRALPAIDAWVQARIESQPE